MLRGSNPQIPHLYIEFLTVPVIKGKCTSVAGQDIGQGQILGSIPTPASEWQAQGSWKTGPKK